ncbi:MAG: response regulator [Planctomycetota bacterium]|jgi:two-component system chemotaxis response regulator CheY
MSFKKNEPAKPQTRILIVEDDSASRGLMQVLLGEYGDCSFATNGVEGVEAFTQALDAAEPFDLVCLDILMPEMDGLEALKQMREVEKTHGIDEADRVKVIMTTTVNQQAKTMKAFYYGCCGYLVKPISRDALVMEMSKLPLERSSNAPWRDR